MSRLIGIVVALTLFFGAQAAHAQETDDQEVYQSPSPSPSPPPSTPPPKTSPPPSTSPSADVPPPSEPKTPPPKTGAILLPEVGIGLGRWIGVPVQRLTLGLSIIRRSKDPSSAHFIVTTILEPGRTENGLQAHRMEAGLGVSTGPSMFRADAGIHLSYAMLVRATKNQSRAFEKALFGDIGGFGVGLHAHLEVAFNVSTDVAFTVAVRGVAEVFDGGTGYQAGPLIGLRF